MQKQDINDEEFFAGATASRKIIEEIFNQAIVNWRRSVKDNNYSHNQQWLKIVAHLMGELNAIDKEIIENTRPIGDESTGR